jgi:hypothetical protein
MSPTICASRRSADVTEALASIDRANVAAVQMTRLAPARTRWRVCGDGDVGDADDVASSIARPRVINY